MKVGITYDLRDDYLNQGCSLEEVAEFDCLETIVAIEHALQQQGFETVRIGNLHQLITALDAGRRWDVVFNIAEGRYGLAREAQIPALLDAYQIPYIFSDPLTLSICLDKSIAKRIVRDHGLPTAAFWVLNDGCELERYTSSYHFPLFVKPLAEGSSKGVGEFSQVTSLAELKKVCPILWKKFKQPVLVETFLPGREFTVGIIGTGEHASVLGVMEILFKPTAEMGSYSFLNKQDWKRRIKLELATDPIAWEAGKVALESWQALRCCDAGRIDIRLDANDVPCFIEVNPLAGLNPENSDLILLGNLLGISYNTLIKRIMQAALTRLGITHPLPAEVA